MSNALYPGLGNTADRPLTADSWKSHRGNPFAKAGSTHTRSRRSSCRLSLSRPAVTPGARSSEDSGNATDHLHDLLRRSQDALGALAAKHSTDNVNGQAGPSHHNGRRLRDSVDTFGSTADSDQWQEPLWKTLSRQSSASTTSTKDTNGHPVVDQHAESHEPTDSASDVQPPQVETATPNPSIRESQHDSDEERGQATEPFPSDALTGAILPGSSAGGTLSDQMSMTLVKTNTALSQSMPSSAGGQSSGLDSEYDRPTGSRGSKGTKPLAVCPNSETVAVATSATGDETSDDDSHIGAHSLYDEKLEVVVTSNQKTKRQEKVVKFDKVDDKTIDSSSLSDDPGKPQVNHSTTATPETGMYGLPLFALTAALSMAVFLVAMDVNVIATAVPHITGEFRSLEDVGWYGSAFLMTTCGFQVLFGRIYTIFQAKWVFVSAILVFMIGSLVAALSSSSTIFIVGRAIQGMGTSGILSGGLIIIAQVVPLRMRSFIGGAIGAMEGVAMISAPVLGGVLTDRLNWRWCFYINLPIGGFVLIVVFLFLRIPEANRPQSAKKATLLQTLYQLDVMGAALLMPPIICLLLALQDGGRPYPSP